MTNETEFAGLLPCPFCGGEAEFKPYKKDGLTIKCKSFGCVRRDQRVLRQSIDWLREAMAKDWNTRTNPPPVDAAAERDAEIRCLDEFLRMASEPIGQQCCGQGNPQYGCCGNAEPVFATPNEVFQAMQFRLDALTAQQQENK